MLAAASGFNSTGSGLMNLNLLLLITGSLSASEELMSDVKFRKEKLVELESAGATDGLRGFSL
jgi:NAD/NADP transhydrogenase beta subunit